MFFVFGSPRSGTTLLAQSLSAHSELMVPYETDFIIPAAAIIDRVKDPAIGRELLANLILNSSGFSISLGEYVSRDAVREIIFSVEYQMGVLLKAIYDAIAKAAGKRLAGDKSPNDLLFLRLLIKVEGITPDMKILHIVRDVRDVMASLKERNWVSDLDLYFPRFWSNSNLYLHSIFKDKPEQYHVLRYEDFVSDPGTALEAVSNHLGVRIEPEMLEPSSRHPRYKQMDDHQKLYDPISTDRIGRFRDKLDKDSILQCEYQAYEALRAFGYPLDSEQ